MDRREELRARRADELRRVTYRKARLARPSATRSTNGPTERCLDHGEVEIDNNKVENSIGPTAVGKRNWLFFGSDGAGERNAVIYTLSRTA